MLNRQIPLFLPTKISFEDNTRRSTRKKIPFYLFFALFDYYTVSFQESLPASQDEAVWLKDWRFDGFLHFRIIALVSVLAVWEHRMSVTICLSTKERRFHLLESSPTKKQSSTAVMDS